MAEDRAFDRLLGLIHPTMAGMSCPKSVVTWYMYFGHGFSMERRDAFQKYYEEAERICICSECTKTLMRSTGLCWRHFLQNAPEWWFKISEIDPQTKTAVR